MYWSENPLEINHSLYFSESNEVATTYGEYGIYLMGARSYTFELWFKTENDRDATLLTNRTSDLNQPVFWGIGIGGAPIGEPELESINFYFVSGNIMIDNFIPADIIGNGWHHVALVKDYENSQVELFLDGISIHVEEDPKGYLGNYPIAIGGWDGPGASEDDTFNGYMDDIRISESVRYYSDFNPFEGYQYNGNNIEGNNGDIIDTDTDILYECNTGEGTT